MAAKITAVREQESEKLLLTLLIHGLKIQKVIEMSLLAVGLPDVEPHINWYKISLPALHSSTGHGSSSQQPNKRSGHSTVNETANWFLAQYSKDYKVV